MPSFFGRKSKKVAPGERTDGVVTQGGAVVLTAAERLLIDKYNFESAMRRFFEENMRMWLYEQISKQQEAWNGPDWQKQPKGDWTKSPGSKNWTKSEVIKLIQDLEDKIFKLKVNTIEYEKPYEYLIAEAETIMSLMSPEPELSSSMMQAVKAEATLPEQESATERVEEDVSKIITKLNEENLGSDEMRSLMLMFDELIKKLGNNINSIEGNLNSDESRIIFSALVEKIKILGFIQKVLKKCDDYKTESKDTALVSIVGDKQKQITELEKRLERMTPTYEQSPTPGKRP